MPSSQPALTCRELEVRASRGFLRHRSSFVSLLCQADERRESDRDHRTGVDEPQRLEDLGAWREAGRNLDNIL